MADVSLICVNGSISVDVNGAPLCSGSWSSVQVPAVFDPSLLDPVAVVDAVGSGFLVAAVPLAIIWGGRVFVSYFFRN